MCGSGRNVFIEELYILTERNIVKGNNSPRKAKGQRERDRLING